MFKQPSNTAFNNKAFSCKTIGNMHESMSRLSDAALEICGAKGHAQIARLLHESEQTITNWASRGVSVPGAVKAELHIGCQAIWVLYGKGTPPLKLPQEQPGILAIATTPIAQHTVQDRAWSNWPFGSIKEAEWNALQPEQRNTIELMVRAYMLGTNGGLKHDAAA